MSSRQLKARLNRLVQQIPELPPAAGPVCRNHGTACGLGTTWPLPYPDNPWEDLNDMIRDAHIRCGKDVGPHPRELWARDWHERVPEAELRKEQLDYEQLIREAKERNERMIAEIQGRAQERIERAGRNH